MHWHNRLSHLSFSSLWVLFLRLFESKVESDIHCEVCQLSKHFWNTYSPINNSNKSSVPFYLVHFDVWEPSPTTSLFGFRYFVSFVDDYSRCTWVYLIKTKGEVHSIFLNFHMIIQSQFGTTIKFLKSDSGGGSTYLHSCKSTWRIVVLYIKLLVFTRHKRIV